MTARPILFSGAMIRAILSGAKTQTRRVVRAIDVVDECASEQLEDYELRGYEFVNGLVARPPGRVGSSLWVRESIHLKERWNEGHEDRALSVYSADGEPTPADSWPWKRNNLPSIHCPRGLSRITLRVTSVRVERLHEISEDDARAEGVYHESDLGPLDISARVLFKSLWDSINAVRAPWSSNPYVWVLGFERCQ